MLLKKSLKQSEFEIGLDHFEMSRKKNYIQICVETKTKMISISFAINRTFFNYWVRIPLRRGVLDTTLCDKVCQWPAAGRWFSPGTPVSSTNKTDGHDITKILLKVAINTISLNHKPFQLLALL